MARSERIARAGAITGATAGAVAMCIAGFISSGAGFWELLAIGVGAAIGCGAVYGWVTIDG